MILLTAFFIGILSAPHCFGMCGGIVGALTMSLAPSIRNDRSTLLQYQLAYNLGRLSAYAAAGLIVGFIGNSLVSWLAPVNGLIFLHTLGALFIILLGLYVGGWYPRLALLEQLGQPLWRRLQPLGQKLLPVSSRRQALLFGMVWGWLPCGMVYSALVFAATGGDPLQSTAIMLAFGLGTLAPVLAAGLLAAQLGRLRQSRSLRTASALLILIMGIASLVFIIHPEWHFNFGVN